MAFLKAENGSSSGRKYLLDRVRHVIGRRPDCDIIVDDNSVSRTHAQILKSGEEFFVEDMNSRNGTHVNDQMIFGRRKLRSGDRIRVCDLVFAFQDDSGTVPRDDQPATINAPRQVLLDEPKASSVATIMSKLDISSREGGVNYATSPEVKLKALVEISKSLGRSLSLDEVLPQVLQSLFKIFVQADRGFILLRDEKGELVPRCTRLRREDSNEPLRLSRTILNEAVTSKQAILSADAASDERFGSSESMVDFRIRSLMCMALLNQEEEVLGVIQLDTLDQRNRFRQEDLDLLASVATQAAGAIDNAALHEKLLKQQAIDLELAKAHEVQRSFLPQAHPQFAGFDFFEHYQPANTIGGDYYDYIPLPEGRLAIVVADVVGHGIPAALLMSRMSASLRLCLSLDMAPHLALQRLNANLASDEYDGRFITLAMVILDPARHEISVVNAGHLPPIIRRQQGDIEVVSKRGGLPLMIDAHQQYPVEVLPFAPGDCLVLYTDGLTEAMNPSGDLFGMTRLLENVDLFDPCRLGEKILASVDEFTQRRPAADDMCLVCCAHTSPHD